MPEYLERKGKPSLAYNFIDGAAPLILFCGGYRSDMNGTKALYFQSLAEKNGQAYVRFDYSGHGESDGRFSEGLIGDWAQDALDIFDHCRKDGQRVVVIGSSMGGWIALLLARARAEHICGLIGIAAAPDFTEEIYHRRLNDVQRTALHENGLVMVTNDYSDDPYEFSLDFYEEARRHLILSHQYSWPFPVHLFQGGQDKDVLPQTVQFIQKALIGTECHIHMIDDGDHRLSRPQDLEKMEAVIKTISAYN